MSRRNSSELARAVTKLKARNRSRNSAAASTAEISLFSRATSAAGVPAGATRPIHASHVASGSPASTTVGTPGNSDSLARPVTTSALSVPARTHRILAAAADATARGVGAFMVEGQMVDAPFVARARAIVDLAERMGPAAPTA